MLMQDAMETRDVAKTKLISLRTEKVVAIHCKIEIFQNEKRLLLCRQSSGVTISMNVLIPIIIYFNII